MLFGLRMRFFVTLLLAMLAIACGGTSAEVLTPAPASVSTPTPMLETVPAFTTLPPSEPAMPTPSPGPTNAPAAETGPTAASVVDAPTVSIGDASFVVELAVTPEQRTQGLSGRPSLAPGTGMLFVFEEEGLRYFWMKDMRFPLDMVWIGAECAVVDISRDVPPPAPGQAVSDLPTYSPSEPAQYVLEINAGEAESADIHAGDMVEFGGSLAGTYGC